MNEELADLIELYLLELKHGSHPTPEEFAARYPEAQQELLDLLPAIAALEGAGSVSSSMAAEEARVDYPERLGEFLLQEQIGHGGMGVVFRAVQKSLNRTVAVKILSPVWNTNERQLQLFENESRLIAKLRHTHIVEIYGAGCDRGYRYYVMALIQGEPLCKKNLQATFPCLSLEEAVARVAVQAAEALAYAHKNGVLHRDIKPSNLLLDNSGNVHVSDFGLATTLNEGEGTPLVTQSHDGTLRYMAPERLLRGENGFAADQYSLGVTLYELLTGRPAFAEQTPGQLIRAICEHPLPPLPARHSDLAVIVNKSIAHAPGDRYPNMEAMARDLHRLLRGEPIEARSSSSWRRLKLWAKRRPAVALLSGVSALLLLTSLTVVSFSYARVSQALASENAQRKLAENNAGIADAAMNRVFNRMIGQRNDDDTLPPSRAHVRLLQDLMPYYEEIASQRDTSNEHIGEAKKNLAQIALQIGDAELAAQNFREAAALLPADSLSSLFCRNELALCLAAANKRSEALDLLKKLAAQFENSSSFAVRLETVRTLQSAARLSRRPPRRVNRHAGRQAPRTASTAAQTGSAPAPPQPPRRQAGLWRAENATAPPAHRTPLPETAQSSESRILYERAARLLAALTAEQPAHPEVRLLQATLLGEAPYLQNILLPAGSRETPFTILDALIREHPDSPRYLTAYVRLAQTLRLSGDNFAANIGQLRQALAYLNTLLGILPGDPEALARFLTLRQKYTEALSDQGLDDQAEKEGERTLGMLNLVTARPEFSPELREKLIALLIRQRARGRKPGAEETTERIDEEIRVLMQSLDADRIEELRRRLHEATERAQQHGRRHAPRKNRRILR